MTPSSATLTSLLLIGCFLGCSTSESGEASRGDTKPDSEHPVGLFRLAVTQSCRDVAPEGDVWALFDARIEMADGSPFPEGRWYFEAPRMGEDLLLPGDRWLPPKDVMGPPSGFSPEVRFQFGGLRQGEDRIRRLTVDVPVVEVLEGVSEDLILRPGQEIQRRFGPLHVSLIGQEDEVSLFLMDQGEEVPTEPFYSTGTRPQEHAWSMTDARGRRLVDAGGGGSSAISEYRYLTSMYENGSVEFPVRLRWRIPRKWRVTMQRFVLEDVPLGPIQDSPEARAIEEWDREIPAGQLECYWSDDQGDAEDEAEDALDAAHKEWDLRVARGEDAGPEPTYREPHVVGLMPVRVVDDATGDPVPGARIDNWWEADTPHAEPWEELLEGSWTTDRDGWALVPTRDHAPWYYVEAPGYAPLGEMALMEEYRLVRGRDIALEVRDWRDQPVPGAVVDALLGCGHTPNARCETAGPDGRLVLRCVDDNRATTMLWVRAPGVAGRSDAYGNWEDLPQEDGVRILRGEPSTVLEGLVLRPDGTPAAGARVGTREAHRGPWTVAGPDGRYRLVGAQPHDDLIAMAPCSDPVPEGFMAPQVEFQPEPGVFTTVRLPAEGRRWPTPEEQDAERERQRQEREAYERGEEKEPEIPPQGPGLRVRVTTAPGVLPFGRVRVVLVRDGDGLAREEAPKFKDGLALRPVAAGAGSWTVTAGNPAGLLRPESRKVDLKEGWVEVAFTLQPNPTWKPRLVERTPEGEEVEFPSPRAGTYYITSEDGVVEATPHVGEDGTLDGSIHVPASGPFAVEYKAEDGRRARVLLEGPPSGAGPALVLPPPPTKEETMYGPRSRSLPEAVLSVRNNDGSPASGAQVDVLSLQPPDPRDLDIRRSDEWCLYLDDQGEVNASFDVGDRLTVKPRDEAGSKHLPFAVRIQGPGPWKFDGPSGAVSVRAVDEAGESLPEFAVVLGEQGVDAIHAVDGEVRLRGASKGHLRLWVGAPGRHPHELRLYLARGEEREVVVRMNAIKVEAPR